MNLQMCHSICRIRRAVLAAAVSLAVVVATPVMARDTAQQPGSAPVRSAAADAGPEHESLEAITVIGGAVGDPRNPRWREGDTDKPVLPVVPEDAFLDAVSAETSEIPQQR